MVRELTEKENKIFMEAFQIINSISSSSISKLLEINIIKQQDTINIACSFISCACINILSHFIIRPLLDVINATDKISQEQMLDELLSSIRIGSLKNLEIMSSKLNIKFN